MNKNAPAKTKSRTSCAAIIFISAFLFSCNKIEPPLNIHLKIQTKPYGPYPTSMIIEFSNQSKKEIKLYNPSDMIWYFGSLEAEINKSTIKFLIRSDISWDIEPSTITIPSNSSFVDTFNILGNTFYPPTCSSGCFPFVKVDSIRFVFENKGLPYPKDNLDGVFVNSNLPFKENTLIGQFKSNWVNCKEFKIDTSNNSSDLIPILLDYDCCDAK